MITPEDYEKFKNAMEEIPGIPITPLGRAINWIYENLNPEDVFSQQQLEEWAKENGMMKSPQEQGK